MPSGPNSDSCAEPLPGLTGRGRYRFGARGEPEVGVRVGDPERIQWQLAQLLQHGAAVEADVFELIAGMVGQPGPVREEVTDGEHPVTAGSDSANHGSSSTTGVSQPMV